MGFEIVVPGAAPIYNVAALRIPVSGLVLLTGLVGWSQGLLRFVEAAALVGVAGKGPEPEPCLRRLRVEPRPYAFEGGGAKTMAPCTSGRKAFVSENRFRSCLRCPPILVLEVGMPEAVRC